MFLRGVTLHRVIRGYGRLIVDRPATRIDKARSPSIATCLRNHLAAEDSGGHRTDGACHSCCHSTPSIASVTRVTAIKGKSKQVRLDRYLRRAEKRYRQSMTRQLFVPNRSVSVACATVRTAWDEKRLSSQKV